MRADSAVGSVTDPATDSGAPAAFGAGFPQHDGLAFHWDPRYNVSELQSPPSSSHHHHDPNISRSSAHDDFNNSNIIHFHPAPPQLPQLQLSDAPRNPNSSSQHPHWPGEHAPDHQASASTDSHPWSSQLTSTSTPSAFPYSSNRPTTPRRPGRRLWNPTNHSPRRPPHQPQVQTLPPVPSIPIVHQPRPQTGDESSLLTPQEQRLSRQSFNSETPGSTSLAVQQTSSQNRSEFTTIGLPSHLQQQDQFSTFLPATFAQDGNIEVMVHDSKNEAPFPIRGSNDLETGVGDGRLRRTPSKITLPAGVGDRPNTGAQDDEGAFDTESQPEWGPDHPCYPHLNPHVPLSSPLYASTRVIRIPRDWLVAGDLAPTFANVYPEVLEPVLSEDEFRNVVGHVNEEVVAAHNPYGLRSWVDSVMGVLTFWMWDDFGFTGVKSRLRRLEEWLERWNRDVGSKDGVQIIPLRRTAYMALDIQIPDPQISPDPVSRPDTRRTEQVPPLAHFPPRLSLT